MFDDEFEPIRVSWRRRLLRWAFWLSALAVIVFAFWAVVSVRADTPVTYSEITEHFRYGSIGSEPGVSLLQPVGGALPPYWVLRAMPSICSDKLPGGFTSLGFVLEPGRDVPIGISRRRRLGIDWAGLNCSVCHTATVRERPGAPSQIVLGMPAQALDLQRFVEFITDCTLDNRLTAETVRGTWPADDGPRMFERLLMRVGLIDRLKLQTLALRNRIEPILGERVPRWGRGRVDTFNPYKAVQFNWPLTRLPPNELIGAADLPSIWNQKPREGMQLHWDGNNDSVDERNLSAALGAGVTPVTVDHDALKRVRDWIWTLPAPPYPYPVDNALADRGSELYRTHCMTCHADVRFRDGVTAGSRVGLVEPRDQIGTDPGRLDSYTAVFAGNQYGLYPDSPYRFKRFRKTNGYANQPLDGLWLRGPFLHNGSVPTLRDLLEPADRRPTVFYRGYDVFDQVKLGFVSDVAEADGRQYFRYDTAIPGNGNRGHEYGTGLTDADKRAIVEYLKRF
jgi:hypothetical protein